jgi:excinuclease ABC subunit B
LKAREVEESVIRETGGNFDVIEVLRELQQEMQIAAANLEYERAALLRDQIAELKEGTGISKIEPKRKAVKYGKRSRTKTART